jgi:hypothetical protein
MEDLSKMSTPENKARQQAFFESLRAQQKENPELRAAWVEATRDGCTGPNLIEFLYAYSIGEELVIGPRQQSRKRILRRFAALAQRLEGDAVDAEQLLNFRWWKDETIAELLSGMHVEMEFEKAEAIRNGIPSSTVSGSFNVKGRLRPDFILALPNTLRMASEGLNWIQRELGKGKGWDERAVGRTIYLAHLVLYWQTVSQKMPAWKHIAALVEGARIAVGPHAICPTEDALRLGFERFRKRNPIISNEIPPAITEYLQTANSGISFITWDRQRTQTAEK